MKKKKPSSKGAGKRLAASEQEAAEIKRAERRVAAGELNERKGAKDSLLAFTQFTLPGYVAAPHHEMIAERLEKIERGELRRLMVFMPPRHGKSELASRRFPAWCLGRRPGMEIIAASYNADLASDFGRQVRDIVGSDEYRRCFAGVGLAAGNRAAERWQTTNGGAYRAVGVGTATTGRGADLLLIDDPFKDRESADSAAVRRRVWDWYRSTAYTRLSPEGCVVVIQTRWHEDDLSGKLIAAMGKKGDRWEVLSLPAISDDGEALWPQRYPLSRLEEIRGTIGPREWSALYMQKPQPDEGTYFQRGWFATWDSLPKGLAIYGTSDYAVTEGGGDFTVHRVWGVDFEGVIYRLDGWRGQTAADQWIETKIDLIHKWQPRCWFGEGGVIQRSVAPMLKRRMRERQVFCRMGWIPSHRDKPSRARGFQARASMGMVRFEPGADVGEFLQFPAGRHDDEVDAASLMGVALDKAHAPVGRPVVKPEVDDADGWGSLGRRGRKDGQADSWKTV